MNRALLTILLALGLGSGCGETPSWELALAPGAVAWDPTPTEAGLPRMIAAMRSSRRMDAIARGQELVASPSPPDGAYHYLGLALLDVGRPEDARPMLEQALRRHPLNASAHAFLAEALIDLGELEAAAAHLRAAQRHLPDLEFLDLLEGRLAYHNEQTERAVAALLRFLESDRFSPRAATAHALLARMASLAGEPAAGARHQAVSELLVQANQFLNAHAQRLAQDPRHVEALIGFAMVKLNLFRNVTPDPGLLSEARGALEHLVSFEPETVVAHYNLGFIATVEGRVDEAFASYDRALELDPGHVSAALNGARLARLEGRLERALGYLERVRPFGHEPEVRPRFNLEDALLTEQMGQEAHALKLLEAAAALDPEDPGIAREKARLAEWLGSSATPPPAESR